MSVRRASLGVRVAVRVGSPGERRIPRRAAGFRSSWPLTDCPSLFVFGSGLPHSWFARPSLGSLGGAS